MSIVAQGGHSGTIIRCTVCGGKRVLPPSVGLYDQRALVFRRVVRVMLTQWQWFELEHAHPEWEKFNERVIRLSAGEVMRAEMGWRT